MLGHCSDSEHDNAYTLSKPTHLVSWPSLNCFQGNSGLGDYHAELIIVVVESPWPAVNSALTGCCTSQGVPKTQDRTHGPPGRPERPRSAVAAHPWPPAAPHASLPTSKSKQWDVVHTAPGHLRAVQDKYVAVRKMSIETQE